MTTRTFDVHMTVTVKGDLGDEEELLVEECLAAIIDEEIRRCEKGETRSGVNLHDLTDVDVRRIET